MKSSPALRVSTCAPPHQSRNTHFVDASLVADSGPVLGAGLERVALTADELENLASLALLRGDEPRAQRLSALAQSQRHEERAAQELARLREHRIAPDAPAPAGWEWKPTGWGGQYLDALEKLPEQRRASASSPRRMSRYFVVSSLTKSSQDTDPAREAPKRPESERLGRCGVYRWGLLGNRRQMIHVACRRRSCHDCAPRVIAEKLAAIPEQLELYAREVDESTWARSLRRKLGRHMKAGKADGWLRIARPDGMALVVSDEPIGPAIDRAQVERLMLGASSSDGRITAAPTWQVDRQRQRCAEWEDEGIATNSPGFVIDHARKRLGLSVSVSDLGTIDFGELTDEQDQRLRFFAQVVTDDEHRLLCQRSSGAAFQRHARALGDELRSAA